MGFLHNFLKGKTFLPSRCIFPAIFYLVYCYLENDFRLHESFLLLSLFSIKQGEKKPFLMIFRIAILPDGNLRILNASKSDEGKYVCRGENVFGSAEIIASVSVKGKKMWLNIS